MTYIENWWIRFLIETNDNNIHIVQLDQSKPEFIGKMSTGKYEEYNKFYLKSGEISEILYFRSIVLNIRSYDVETLIATS